ncbi:MAG: hypothetical protein NT031_15615 [Planctomycetota bacterium]|nr:hypothetical protein [Planctomycetota bacterium]
MPLVINVGLSRKASENYQSTGVSINVSAELDQSLLARPAELQEQVASLYQQAEAALDRQAGQPQQPATPVATTARNGSGQPANGHGGNGNGQSNGQTPAPMTASQSRAITAIAQRLGIDAAAECRKVLSSDLSHLNVRQASALIDHLKGLAEPAATGGSIA